MERLRRLSPPVRYLAYVAVTLLVFLAAVGIGAAVAVVIGWPVEQTATGLGGLAESGTVEDTGVETTDSTDMLEATAMDTTSGVENTDFDRTVDGASFVHSATDANSRGDYTYLDDPSIDGDPNAVVLVEPSTDQEGAGATTYDHNIGVWYDFVDQKRWAIFNQDRSPVSTGATFDVLIPQGRRTFVHRATLVNTVENSTYLDDPRTNGQPDAVLSVTQNWNPGGGSGVYNDHPIGVLYDEDVEKWAIYNRDGAPMPEGAAFNIAASGVAETAR